MEYKIFHNPEKNDKEFWGLTGWFFASRQVEKELGAPIHHDDGMIWVIAVEQNKAVGISAIEIKKNGTGYLKHAYVISEYRHKGIYTTMVKKRLVILDKTETIRSTCTDKSLPILLKMGFREYGTRGKYTLVEYEW